MTVIYECEPVTKPARLSPSSISSWTQCPLKYKWSRIDKLPEPPTSAQVLGNMTHETLEELLMLPVGNRTRPEARQIMVRQWHEKWDEHCANELRLGPYDRHLLRWNAWSCVENYFGLEDPNEIEPSGLEDELFGEVAGVPVLGFIDRWLMTDDGAVISDYKTGKVSKPPYDAEKRLQLMVYVDLVESLKGVKVVDTELIYLKGKGTKVTYEPTEAHRQTMRVTVDKVWSELDKSCEAGTFATNKTKLCDWCAYKGQCPAWQRRR